MERRFDTRTGNFSFRISNISERELQENMNLYNLASDHSVYRHDNTARIDPQNYGCERFRNKYTDAFYCLLNSLPTNEEKLAFCAGSCSDTILLSWAFQEFQQFTQDGQPKTWFNFIQEWLYFLKQERFIENFMFTKFEPEEGTTNLIDYILPCDALRGREIIVSFIFFTSYLVLKIYCRCFQATKSTV